MTRTIPASLAHVVRAAVLAVVAVLLIPAAFAQDASALRARQAALHDRFSSNPFGRPLVLESTQTSSGLRGDVYAIVDHPFSAVQPALQSIDHWCDILILHLNVKHCRANSANKTINLRVGRKFDQPIEDAYELDFKFAVAAATTDYLQILLTAKDGPLSTKDYRIQVEAIPSGDGKSLIHMSYAYGYGFAARLAMETYLATIGRDKVGFSVVDHKNGKPVYVGGVLGLLERNTMRYYLAIDAFLDAASLPAAQQPEQRIRDWYASTERYARQLHEMDENDYLDMKRKEIRLDRKPG
ncbi:MAG TPA: hypothetical protein VFF72_13415 [Caldimonas sp.]|nr:hypothetical protein [Caldimonas sp.]